MRVEACVIETAVVLNTGMLLHPVSSSDNKCLLSYRIWPAVFFSFDRPVVSSCLWWQRDTGVGSGGKELLLVELVVIPRVHNGCDVGIFVGDVLGC